MMDSIKPCQKPLYDMLVKVLAWKDHDHVKAVVLTKAISMANGKCFLIGVGAGVAMGFLIAALVG